MSVSSLERLCNGLFLRADVLPGAEADGGDGGAGVELECGHFLRVLVFVSFRFVSCICCN
jgi:hypothetical protein